MQLRRVENRIEKSFKDLDFDQVDFQQRNWMFSKGGLPLSDDEWSISYIDKEGTEIRYKLPHCINQMINAVSKNSVDGFKSKIRDLLGIY